LDTGLLERLAEVFEEVIPVNGKGEVIPHGVKLWERFPSLEAVKAHRELFEVGESSFQFEERGKVYLFKGKLIGEGIGVFLREEITLKKSLEEIKREAVSTLSHQIKTPLTVIKGNAELLLAGEKDEELLREIGKKAEEIEEVIEGVKRLFDGAQKFGVVNLSALAGEVCRSFERKAKEKGLEFVKEIEEVSLPAEGALFKQMVANLLDNAVKFTRRGRVRLVLKREFLRVEDSGSGVEEEVRERLFERFVKGKGSSGEGIGLSVVKEIAELHGWAVGYESSKGGSVFTVRFKGVAEDFGKET